MAALGERAPVRSNDMETSDDLTIALRASDRAGELAQRYFNAGVRATTKADGTLVTEADGAVEELLRHHLGTACPGDAFLGEEMGATGTSDRVWILDPIDSTSSFSRGNPNWRVHVTLEVAGQLEVAVVTAPAINRQWWAARGQGAFEAPWPGREDPARLAVSATADIGDATLDALNGAFKRLPTEATFATPRATGWCGGLMDLLRGDVDCFFAECCQVWDHAPWILLVEEAGGRFTNPEGGNSGDRNGGLYSNAELHEVLIASLGYPQVS